MQDRHALPIICEAQSCIYAQRSAYLKILINHPHLHDEEKLLWLWLATTEANNVSFTCSINYRHISEALNVPLRFVHRTLFRLKLMGFLISSDIPIYYGEPTPDMAAQVRIIELLLPPKPLLLHNDDNPRWPLQGKKLLQRQSTHVNTTQSQPQKKETNRLKQLVRFSITLTFFLIKKLRHVIAAYFKYGRRVWRWM